MEEKDLVKGWALARPKRMMSGQISVRLPVDVWVGVLALCKMFPGRTRTQIIGDLLASALERVRENLSSEPDPGEKDVSPGPYYGQRGRYECLTEFYTKEFVEEGDWFYEDERKRRAPDRPPRQGRRRGPEATNQVASGEEPAAGERTTSFQTRRT